MAESWIRMRGSLVNNPRVIAMARALLADPDFLEWYGHDGVTPESSRSVTMRHVTVVTRVTVGALTSLWSMVNECAARDGVVTRVTLFEVDGMAGVPGIGKAMVTVGWLQELPDGVCFPNFSEHNTVTESRSTGAKTAAQRSREYRNRNKDSVTTSDTESSRDASRDGVTENRDASRDAVTTEKSREEKSNTSSLRSEDGHADAGPSAELTKAELWKAGKSLLNTAGMPLAQCGSFVGKLVKDYGETVVVEAVRSAVVTQPADPAEWLKAACMRATGQRSTTKKQTGKHSGFENFDYSEGINPDGTIA